MPSAGNSHTTEEFLDIINELDEVVGRASIDDIYARRLSHRTVHVLVYDPEGRLALQRRSQQKAYCPGCWCSSAGGHAQSGESPEVAAARELQEELGISAPLTFIGKAWFQDPLDGSFRKVVNVYSARHSGPFRLDPAEVEQVEFFTNDTIHQMLERGEILHTEFAFVLRQFYPRT